jgi:hypothetical protein
VELFFDAAVRHHLAADLGEAREAVGDAQEAVVVEQRDVARDVPAVAQGLVREVVATEVALHHVRAADEQHARRVGREVDEGVGIDDAAHDAGHRLADVAAAPSGLVETGGAEVGVAHGDDGRALGGAVALERPDAELVLERVGEAVRELLGAGEDEAQ